MSDFNPGSYGAGIADEYDALYEGYLETDAAIERIIELAAGGAVLELGIGTGRLAVPLAAHGLEVHGVDASPEMVEVLRMKPGGAQIPVVIGDFAEVHAGSDFTLVVLAFNTIFALPDQRAQVCCFANAARHLRPGGRFVVEAWIPDLGDFHHNRAVRPRIGRSDVVSIEVVDVDPVDQMMRTTQIVLRDGSVRLHPANHRYAWPAELDLMAELAGMRRIDRWENWRGTPFTADSREHVTVYQRET
ncbi:MAG TPA: methyltransferase domain-containing protein [Acidimicrobiales bacterium]